MKISMISNHTFAHVKAWQVDDVVACTSYLDEQKLPHWFVPLQQHDGSLNSRTQIFVHVILIAYHRALATAFHVRDFCGYCETPVKVEIFKYVILCIFTIELAAAAVAAVARENNEKKVFVSVTADAAAGAAAATAAAAAAAFADSAFLSSNKWSLEKQKSVCLESEQTSVDLTDGSYRPLNRTSVYLHLSFGPL